MIKPLLAALTAVALTTGMLHSAHATKVEVGHPCEVSWEGYGAPRVSFSLYTQPGCSGTFLGVFYLFIGASSYGTSHTEAMVLASYQNLVQAVASGLRVYAQTVAANDFAVWVLRFKE